MNALEPSLENRRVLVVDDNPAILHDFRKVLAPANERRAALRKTEAQLFAANPQASVFIPFQVQCVSQGEEALNCVTQAFHCRQPFATAFVDVRMPPGWDGVETVQRIWQIDPDIMIVICTAYSDYRWEDLSMQLPRPEQFLILRKPFDPIEVRQCASALTTKWKLARQVELQMREITATRDTVVFSLAQLADWRDPETGEHLQRMRAYSQLVAEELSNSEGYSDLVDAQFLEDLYRASPLHDLGKVGIPDRILLKPGRLTPEEFELMKRHTTIGADTLRRAMRHTTYGNFLQMAVDVAENHHEQFDGTGYPNRLRGNQIPLAARIVAVADVFDALTSSRVYKPAMEIEKAKIAILSEAGQHFDPDIVSAFCACYDKIKQTYQQFTEEREKISAAYETESLSSFPSQESAQSQSVGVVSTC